MSIRVSCLINLYLYIKIKIKIRLIFLYKLSLFESIFRSTKKLVYGKYYSLSIIISRSHKSGTKVVYDRKRNSESSYEAHLQFPKK